VAGFVPQSNWNNVLPPAPTGGTVNINSPVAGSMVDNQGNVISAQVSWINANAEVNSDTGNTTPNERLYRGLLEGPSVQQTNHLTVTASSIPYATYNLIVYLEGFGFDADASVKVGGQATTFATRTLATYAEFDGLTSPSVAIEMITQAGNRVGIAGFQVVGVPEPSTWALLATGSVALLAFGWKSRARARHLGAAL
jgi:hypothetical protein